MASSGGRSGEEHMILTPNAIWLIAAMLFQGALAIGLLLYLGVTRIPLILSGKVAIRDIALDKDAWPERARQASNGFDNQFQLPVLFYVACMVAIGFGATLLEVVLAVLFVVSRYLHAYIHVTTNHVVSRFSAYLAGLVILCLFWLDLAIRLVAIALGAS
jgi:hypothetical protein